MIPPLSGSEGNRHRFRLLWEIEEALERPIDQEETLQLLKLLQ